MSRRQFLVPFCQHPNIPKAWQQKYLMLKTLVIKTIMHLMNWNAVILNCYLFPTTTISAVTSSIIIVIEYYYPYQHMRDFFRQIVATINHINEAHGIVCLWFVVRWRNCPHHHHPWVNFVFFLLMTCWVCDKIALIIFSLVSAVLHS